MNRDNVLMLRGLMERVARNPDRFNMAHYYGEGEEEAEFTDRLGSLQGAIEHFGARVLHPDPAHCGAPACMAGWCQLKFASTRYERSMSAFGFAGKFCGLEYSEARHWFSGWWSEKPLPEITADEALAFLDRQLAEETCGYGVAAL